jgi:hypothetical protein
MRDRLAFGLFLSHDPVILNSPSTLYMLVSARSCYHLLLFSLGRVASQRARESDTISSLVSYSSRVHVGGDSPEIIAAPELVGVHH